VSAAKGYQIPERILKLTDGVAERYGIKVRQIDMNEYDRDVDIFLDISNKSIIQNWGYSPVTDAEAMVMAKDLKRVLQPKGVLFAEDDSGRAVGYAVVLPDINTLLKGLNGRLLPFGFIKLLRGIPRLTCYRMFALGVLPEYQRKAIDSLLYRELYRTLYSEDLRMEINYVLEDNWIMINAIEKLNANRSRRYRVYEMKI
jgi:ribosomal protein S18 acetylase RimI-like enzyme